MSLPALPRGRGTHAAAPLGIQGSLRGAEANRRRHGRGNTCSWGNMVFRTHRPTVLVMKRLSQRPCRWPLWRGAASPSHGTDRPNGDRESVHSGKRKMLGTKGSDALCSFEGVTRYPVIVHAPHVIKRVSSLPAPQVPSEQHPGPCGSFTSSWPWGQPCSVGRAVGRNTPPAPKEPPPSPSPRPRSSPTWQLSPSAESGRPAVALGCHWDWDCCQARVTLTGAELVWELFTAP